MIELKPGQNTALGADIVRFTIEDSAGAPAELGALVVGTDLQVGDDRDAVRPAQPAAPGVRLSADGVEVTLSQVRADAHAVLLLASAATALPGLTAVLSENGTATARFAIVPAAGESALICFELYRRAGAWKLRAVGQGYAGGAAQLLAAHGAKPVAAPVAPSAPQPSAPTVVEARFQPPPVPTEVEHGLQRLWMIFEDAARSAASLVSSREYAANRLDQELSAAVADPALRNSAAGEAARAQAQRRHDELVATAEAAHQRDADQLAGELAEADTLVPQAMASWLSPVWATPPRPSDGIRLGELHAPDRGGLRVPYCVPVPLNRPLWVDTESSLAAAPVVGALLARLLAAVPDRRTVFDIIDLTGGLADLAGALGPRLAGPVVSDHLGISARLGELAHRAELADIAYQSGQGVPPTEHRVLVVSDFPHGYQSSDVVRVGQLMMRGDLIGLSLVIVGSGNIDQTDSTLAMLAQSCRQLPTMPGSPLFDPWAGSAWQLELDQLPSEPELRARYLRP
ncbi:TerD family protein [Nocardia thailandica]|uniref:TerD family protein n=1 Tax=Nocardia thailandica TaxID=257275 RepID=UPI000304129E|nr:TerD family protein [Nocardia thailandica]